MSETPNSFLGHATPTSVHSQRAQAVHGSLQPESSTITPQLAFATVSVISALFATLRRSRVQRTGLRSRTSYVRLRSGGEECKDEVLDAVVVGAGLSGLCTAFGLQKDLASSSIAVTEASDRVGGNIDTREEDGRRWEDGPNSFQPSETILSLASELGLRDDVVLADPKAYRFVWHEGALRALPAGLSDALFGDFMSLQGKIRAGLGAMGWKERMPDKEESIKEFVSRNLGSEAFERLIDPFVSGVYAGDPSKLSAEVAFGKAHRLEKSSGSFLGAGIKNWLRNMQEYVATALSRNCPHVPKDPLLRGGQTVGSFRRGLQQLPDTLSARIRKLGTPVRLGWSLKRMTWDSTRQENVLDYETPTGPQQLRSRAVIITTPAWVTSKIVRPLSEESSDALAEVQYPRVAEVTVEYPKSAFRDQAHGKGIVNGFGQLHPRSQGVRTLGTIYASSLFPNRTDPDKVILVHFFGGSQDPELFGGMSEMSEQEIVEATHQDTVLTLLRPEAADDLPKVLSVKIWPQAIPQLNLGHSTRLERAREGFNAAGVKGVFLAGNYVGGVSLGNCIEMGLAISKEAAEFAIAARSTAAA